MRLSTLSGDAAAEGGGDEGSFDTLRMSLRQARQVRIDRQEGDLLSPPLNWRHQPFTLDPEQPARYLAVTNVPLMAGVRAFKKERRR
ncbi:MAG: hypothetical protein HY690_20240 [Chloroflexi bacterium]|nr:hypothetical protein [Chloroflexota bacterium]